MSFECILLGIMYYAFKCGTKSSQLVCSRLPRLIPKVSDLVGIRQDVELSLTLVLVSQLCTINYAYFLLCENHVELIMSPLYTSSHRQLCIIHTWPPPPLGLWYDVGVLASIKSQVTKVKCEWSLKESDIYVVDYNITVHYPKG